MKGKRSSFRVGRVRADLRGSVWYLTYHEDGRRHRPRVGPDRDAVRQMAAEINSQLEAGAPSALSFEPLTIAELRDRWLGHHENVLRSSVRTIDRYRTATNHLLTFIRDGRVSDRAPSFRVQHAAEFVRYLRTIQVAPNGHENSQRRPLLDKGIKFILCCCRTMFNYAMKRRHLSPYSENPFSELDVDRIPIENAKPVIIFTPELERRFLEACDDWQFPIFLTLLWTGLRPGELCHLLLPDDLDLNRGMLSVRNKPKLGWQVKTRSEREIPLVDPLVSVLRIAVGHRTTGPVFLQRRFENAERPSLAGCTTRALEQEVENRIVERERDSAGQLSRGQRLRIARSVWRDAGVVKTDRIRKEFMRLTGSIESAEWTAPKVLRHQFATALQDANVDPLIRCELMGHAIGNSRNSSHGLGMTANYTHTRPETKRRQLTAALECRPSFEYATTRFQQRGLRLRGDQ
jgi:integrase